MSFLAGKKVLVLGGTGFLGSNLVRYLLRDLDLEPASVRVFYLAGTAADSLRDLPGLDLFPGDILSAEDVGRACDGAEYVFHLAASTSFDPGRKRQQWLVNVEGTRLVLEAVGRSASFKKLCYTSTVNTLGVPRPRGSLGRLADCDPYTSRPRLHAFRSAEEALSFAQAVRQARQRGWERHIGLGYFDSKLTAQELVQSYAVRSGLNVVSVLPGTAFGPYDFFIGNGLYVLRLFQGRMPGVLRGGFSAAHVKDVVEGHLLAMEHGAPGSRHIITGRAEDSLRLKQVMRVIADVLRERYPRRRIRTPSLVFPAWMAWIAALFSEEAAALRHKPCLLSRAMVKAGSQPLFYSSSDAARDLGYVPKRSFRQGIEDMVDYYRAQGFFGPDSD